MKLKNLMALTFAVLAAAGVSLLAQTPVATSRGVMTLSMSNGNCIKTLSGNDGGDRIRAKRNGTVRWEVTNNCTSAATVSVDDFIRKGGSADDPFVAGKTDCAAAPGKSCSISLSVKSNASVQTYSYSVSINGTKQDPDLIIEG